MIFVNISYLVAIGILLIIYKFIYPKRKVNLLYLLIALSIGTSISIFRPGSYESGDFNIHIYRAIDFYKNLSEGIIIPSWAPTLNATYGYPLFIFNYSLPYYLISFFHLLGFTLIDSLKIFLVLNLILPAVFMFKFIEFKFKNKLGAFVGSVFYLFFPYHLVAIHFKITIGEILAYTLVPLVFLYLEKFIKNSNIKYLIISGLFFGLIALSHLFVAIFLSPLLLIYIAIKINNLAQAIKVFLSISLITTLVSAYQWAPVLIFREILFTTEFPIDINTIYFPSITDLLFSPWRYGLLFQGPQGEISHLIGYAQILVVLGLIYILLKNKLNKNFKKEALLFIVLFFSITFLMLPITKVAWSYLPVLGIAGPHRLLIILGFISSVIAVYLAITLKKKALIYGIVIFAILTTILNWGQRRIIPEINDSVLKANLSKSTYLGEAHFYANTKYVDPVNPWFEEIPENKIESLTLDNSIKYKELSRIVTNHSYLISTERKTIVSEKTLYFPGWSVYANGKEIRTFPGKSGEINFALNKGAYEIDVRYQDVDLLKLFKLLSISTMLYLFIKIVVLPKK
jgi:hypothetical protein